jgi:HPr kinase/phosphorylase
VPPADVIPERDVRIEHASCVAWQGRALLIRGAAGQGKSTLALTLMAWGGGLVSDDRTCLWREGDGVMADAPDTLRGLIEARNVGILNAAPAGPTRVVAVVDLDRAERDRMPHTRQVDLLGAALPLLSAGAAPHLAPALLQYLKAGRWEDI